MAVNVTGVGLHNAGIYDDLQVNFQQLWNRMDKEDLWCQHTESFRTCVENI